MNTLENNCLPLFRSTDPETSVLAAESAMPMCNRHRRLILVALRARNGTKDEIAQRCNLTGTQVARRMKSLIEDGLVGVSSEKRMTETGRMARVYFLAKNKL